MGFSKMRLKSWEFIAHISFRCVLGKMVISQQNNFPSARINVEYTYLIWFMPRYNPLQIFPQYKITVLIPSVSFFTFAPVIWQFPLQDPVSYTRWSVTTFLTTLFPSFFHFFTIRWRTTAKTSYITKLHNPVQVPK